MWKMLQREEPDDYVIATGQSHSLEKFVELAFMEAGLDFRDHVDVDPALFRPTDLAISKANPSKAAAELGWRAESSMAQVIRNMISARSEEHTSELQSLMRISYAVFCLKKKNTDNQHNRTTQNT